MGDAYRKGPDSDVLGEAARESDAIKAFGTWRDRIRMRVILVFALVGLVPAGLAWYYVQELQFEHNHGQALLVANVGSAAIAWGSVFAIGAFIARRMVGARSRETLEWLAKVYDVNLSNLEDTAAMVNKL